MRNEKISKIQSILQATRSLPLFTLDDLVSIESDKNYLKILFSRHGKSGSVVRLKKGTYVTKAYVDAVEKSGRLPVYAEFLASVLYAPSYLSLEYVLHQHGIITELPAVITAVAKKKTASFATPFGTYRYHSIAPALFSGFTTTRDGDYHIARASKAKALFDYLHLRPLPAYLRKPKLNLAEELRLNIEEFPDIDREEFGHFAEESQSRKMTDILNNFRSNVWRT